MMYYLEDTHCVDDCLFDGWSAYNVVVDQEVVTDSHQRILGPALEPIHRTARDQTREL